jgi:hypothetical protein
MDLDAEFQVEKRPTIYTVLKTRQISEKIREEVP